MIKEREKSCREKKPWELRWECSLKQKQKITNIQFSIRPQFVGTLFIVRCTHLLFNANFSACTLIIDSEIHKQEQYPFFIVKDFFLKQSFISALIIVVNLLFFSSIHCCFVYLQFQQASLWRISAFKEEKIWTSWTFFFGFTLLVLNVFVYNGLK